MKYRIFVSVKYLNETIFMDFLNMIKRHGKYDYFTEEIKERGSDWKLRVLSFEKNVSFNKLSVFYKKFNNSLAFFSASVLGIPLIKAGMQTFSNAVNSGSNW